jgi:hypothetical protein
MQRFIPEKGCIVHASPIKIYEANRKEEVQKHYPWPTFKGT